jgi:membrane protein
LVRRVIREQGAEQVGLAASGAAFWLVISAFPTAIAAISVFGLVVSPERVAKDLGTLASAGPASLGSLVTDQLRRVAATDHVGLSVGVAASLIVAVWSASAGIYNLDRAIRVAYGLRPNTYLEARGRAFVGAFVVVLGVGAGALVSAGVSVLLTRVPAAAVGIVGTPLLVAVIACVIAGLYRFSVGHRVGIRNLLPGALGSAIGLVLLSAGFAVYVRFSTRYTAVYGTLAGAVIGMVGTYLAVYVVLMGAVLNVQVGGQVGVEVDKPPDADRS